MAHLLPLSFYALLWLLCHFRLKFCWVQQGKSCCSMNLSKCVEIWVNLVKDVLLKCFTYNLFLKQKTQEFLILMSVLFIVFVSNNFFGFVKVRRFTILVCILVKLFWELFNIQNVVPSFFYYSTWMLAFFLRVQM